MGHDDIRNRYRVSARKHRRRWENDKMHLEEMTNDSVDCIHLALDKNEWHAGSYENSYRASGSVKGGEFLD